MRLPPLAPDLLDPDRRALHDAMAGVVAEHLKGFVSARTDGALVGPFPALLHFPQFGAPIWDFTVALIDHARLPAKVREVAILVTGARFESRYELYAHERVAVAAGLPAATVATIVAGQRPPDLDPTEAVAYDLASALVAGREVPSSLYEAARGAFGEEGVAELSYLVGCYCVVSLLLNTFAAPVPEQDEEGRAG